MCVKHSRLPPLPAALPTHQRGLEKTSKYRCLGASALYKNDHLRCLCEPGCTFGSEELGQAKKLKIYIALCQFCESNPGCRSLYETCVSRQTEPAAWPSEPTAAPKAYNDRADKICKTAVNAVSGFAAHLVARAFHGQLAVLSWPL